MRVKSLQLCPTLCDPMDCSPPGSSVQRILQAGILKWVVLSFSRGSSQPRDRTHVSMSPALAGRFFTTSTTWEAQAQLKAQHFHDISAICVPTLFSLFGLLLSSCFML